MLMNVYLWYSFQSAKMGGPFEKSVVSKFKFPTEKQIYLDCNTKLHLFK